MYLEDLYVSPDQRGLGAGKAILRYLARSATASPEKISNRLPAAPLAGILRESRVTRSGARTRTLPRKRTLLTQRDRSAVAEITSGAVKQEWGCARASTKRQRPLIQG
jgi:hypothetical protein